MRVNLPARSNQFPLSYWEFHEGTYLDDTLLNLKIYPTPLELQTPLLVFPLPPLYSVTLQSYGDLSAFLLTAQSVNAATSNDGGRAIREQKVHHLLSALLY